jgi:hypothetical protein
VATPPNIDNTRSLRLVERLGMTPCFDEDFDQPAMPEGEPLRPHIPSRIHRPQ